MSTVISEVVKAKRGQQMESIHVRLPADIIAQIDKAIEQAKADGTKVTRSDVCRTGILFFWNSRLQTVDTNS